MKNDKHNPSGLYDAPFEHDSCGVGFIVNIKGTKSHKLVRQAFEIGINLLHRGACGCEKNTGDGAGILLSSQHGDGPRREGSVAPPPDGEALSCKTCHNGKVHILMPEKKD